MIDAMISTMITSKEISARRGPPRVQRQWAPPLITSYDHLQWSVQCKLLQWSPPALVKCNCDLAVQRRYNFNFTGHAVTLRFFCKFWLCCVRWDTTVLALTMNLLCTLWPHVSLRKVLPGIWVIRRIRTIRRMVFNAYFTVLNKLGRYIRLQHLPFLAFLGNFRPNNGFSVSLLLYNISITYNILENNWKRL